MFRSTGLAALGLALMSSVALAQPADQYDRSSDAPPAQLNAPDDRIYDDQDDRNLPPSSQQQADANSRDLFCRRDAAARTGYVSPGQAADRAQTNGSVGGAVLGAAAGAAIGSASGHAGAGALIGAGAGLIAGTAIGQDNARRAADNAEQDYADAYYACLNEADGGTPAQYAQAPRYAYDDYGPPPGYYPYYYPYPRPYFGPSLSLGFRFGGGPAFRGGFRGGYYGGFRGGMRHR